ncbi:MAG: hypothetical protein C0403_14485 [Desulfobacterium sp.]|nr:hypothetical protein [Desulfobacterium sp.]
MEGHVGVCAARLEDNTEKEVEEWRLVTEIKYAAREIGSEKKGIDELHVVEEGAVLELETVDQCVEDSGGDETENDDEQPAARLILVGILECRYVGGKKAHVGGPKCV